MLNYRAALICSIIAEVNRDRKKRTKPYTPSDFMPKVEKRREELSGKEIADRVATMNTILGGKTI